MLCLQKVAVTWQSKIRTVIIDGRHWPDCDSGASFYATHPLTAPPALSALTLPANTILIAGGDQTDGIISGPYWKCNTPENRGIFYPTEAYICQSLPCPDSGSEPPPEESEWWEDEYTFKGYYYALRIVPDCCACQWSVTGTDCGEYGVDPLACGGINQIEMDAMGYYAAQYLKSQSCDFPFACGIPCWEAPPCNPLP